MKKKNNISLNDNNFIEDSKNNTLNMNNRNFSNFTILKRNNRASVKLNKIIKKNKTYIKTELQYAPKKNLINIISSKHLLGKENKTINSSRINGKLIIKNYINPKIVNPDEYIKINKIGHGAFGKIYKVIWSKNNKRYAMKEMIFQSSDNIIYLKERLKNIVDFQKKSKCDGIIKTYGDCSVKKSEQYFYYEIMELAERDWEKEINIRKKGFDYYSEKELINIMAQLVKTLSQLQKNHITHRDIKLQNILIIKNKYKICDFGESRTINQKGTIVQPVRGSELYMSPILFCGLQEKALTVTHNTYKSDVFSLGMCILFAASLNENCLYEIREMTNMDKIRKVLEYYLYKRYSNIFIEILLYMLEINEKKRPDFIHLEKIFSQSEIIN
jgi:NIMA (never in mitosis gene a)-related kinase